MLSEIFANQQYSKKIVSLADAVSYHRPKPLREFDQIYMMSGDMFTQANLMKDYMSSKRVVFLGDGDGMSMLFGLLATKNEMTKPHHMLILDFDQRILTNINRFAERNAFKESGIAIETGLYNVIDSVCQMNILEGLISFT